MLSFNEINSDRRKLYLFSALLIPLLSLLLFIPKDISRTVTAVLLVLSAVAVLLLIKKRKVPSINTKTVALILFAVAGLSIALYYLTGIRFDFIKNPYASSFGKSLLYVLCVAVSVIAMEIIRNVIIAQEDKLSTVLVTLSGILADVLISTKVVTAMNFNNFIDLTAMVLFPAVASNLFYNYVAKRYGALPNIVYRLPVLLYVYVIAVLPHMPDSLLAFARLLIPVFAYFFIDLLYGKRKKRATISHKWKWAAPVAFALSSFFMISVVMLISCQFRFGLIVIATESMTGEINKGDAVVYESYDGDVIRSGDVIVYDKEGTRMVHRVVAIERINGQTRYYTKGDANEDNDEGYITDANVLGKVNFKLTGVGYPTLWLRSIFTDE